MQTRVFAHPTGHHMAWALLVGLALVAGCKHEREPGAGSAGSGAAKSSGPVTINIVDVAGTIQLVQDALEAYRFHEAAHVVYHFFWGEYCDWYLELIKSRLADVATIVDENINGVRVVKSFAAEPRQLRLLSKAADRLQWAYIRDADYRARFTPWVQNLVQIGLVLVLFFGGWLVVHDKLQVGDILTFSFFIVMLQAPFQLLGMLIMLGQRAKASAGRIYQILDEQPQIVDRAGAIDLVECDGDVRLRHVEFAYATADADVPGRTVAAGTVAGLDVRWIGSAAGTDVVVRDHVAVPGRRRLGHGRHPRRAELFRPFAVRLALGTGPDGCG